MELDTRHLRLVKAVADAGSISGAAPLLGTTQPAVTRQLRRIETGLGGALFRRSREGVEPTELGRLVVGRADAALAIIDSLQSDIAALNAEGTPTHVRIGARTGPMLVGLMAGLRKLIGGIEITAESENRIGALIDLMAAGQIDIAIIREFVGFEIPLDTRFSARPIAIEDVSIAMHPDHRLAGRDEVDIADLAEEKWLLSPLDVDREADCITSVCAKGGFAPQVVQYVAQSFAYDLIRSGEAIACTLPRRAARGVTTVELRGKPIQVRHLLVTPRKGPLEGYVDDLVPYLRDALATVQPGTASPETAG